MAIQKQKYTAHTRKNILQVYQHIGPEQLFGLAQIAEILVCSPANARKIMDKLKTLGVVCEVKGKGKGKYRFLRNNETDVIVVS